MEKTTGFEPIEKERIGSSMERESGHVKTVAEKEIVVQNVEYADAVKDLSPWVSYFDGQHHLVMPTSDFWRLTPGSTSRRDTSNCTSVWP